MIIRYLKINFCTFASNQIEKFHFKLLSVYSLFLFTISKCSEFIFIKPEIGVINFNFAKGEFIDNFFGFC